MRSAPTMLGRLSGDEVGLAAGRRFKRCVENITPDRDPKARRPVRADADHADHRGRLIEKFHNFINATARKTAVMFHNIDYANDPCRRDIQRSPPLQSSICKVQTALSVILGSLEGVSDDGGVNDQEGVFAPRIVGRFSLDWPQQFASKRPRPLAEPCDLDDVFAWKEERTVSNALTLQYDRVLFLLQPNEFTRPLARKRVTVIDYPDGRLSIQYEARPALQRVRQAAKGRSGCDCREQAIGRSSRLRRGAAEDLRTGNAIPKGPAPTWASQAAYLQAGMNSPGPITPSICGSTRRLAPPPLLPTTSLEADASAELLILFSG